MAFTSLSRRFYDPHVNDTPCPTKYDLSHSITSFPPRKPPYMHKFYNNETVLCDHHLSWEENYAPFGSLNPRFKEKTNPGDKVKNQNAEFYEIERLGHPVSRVVRSAPFMTSSSRFTNSKVSLSTDTYPELLVGSTGSSEQVDNTHHTKPKSRELLTCCPSPPAFPHDSFGYSWNPNNIFEIEKNIPEHTSTMTHSSIMDSNYDFVKPRLSRNVYVSRQPHDKIIDNIEDKKENLLHSLSIGQAERKYASMEVSKGDKIRKQRNLLKSSPSPAFVNLSVKSEMLKEKRYETYNPGPTSYKVESISSFRKEKRNGFFNSSTERFYNPHTDSNKNESEFDYNISSSIRGSSNTSGVFLRSTEPRFRPSYKPDTDIENIYDDDVEIEKLFPINRSRVESKSANSFFAPKSFNSTCGPGQFKFGTSSSRFHEKLEPSLEDPLYHEIAYAEPEQKPASIKKFKNRPSRKPLTKTERPQRESPSDIRSYYPKPINDLFKIKSQYNLGFGTSHSPLANLNETSKLPGPGHYNVSPDMKRRKSGSRQKSSNFKKSNTHVFEKMKKLVEKNVYVGPEYNLNLRGPITKKSFNKRYQEGHLNLERVLC